MNILVFHNTYFYVLEHSESFPFKKNTEMVTDRRVEVGGPQFRLPFFSDRTTKRGSISSF